MTDSMTVFDCQGRSSCFCCLLRSRTLSTDSERTNQPNGWRFGYGAFLLWSTIAAGRLWWVKRRPSIDAHSLAAQEATNKAFDMK